MEKRVFTPKKIIASMRLYPNVNLKIIKSRMEAGYIKPCSIVTKGSPTKYDVTNTLKFCMAAMLEEDHNFSIADAAEYANQFLQVLNSRDKSLWLGTYVGMKSSVCYRSFLLAKQEPIENDETLTLNPLPGLYFPIIKSEYHDVLKKLGNKIDEFRCLDASSIMNECIRRLEITADELTEIETIYGNKYELI